jgi:hypothetical protein
LIQTIAVGKILLAAQIMRIFHMHPKGEKAEDPLDRYANFNRDAE